MKLIIPPIEAKMIRMFAEFATSPRIEMPVRDLEGTIHKVPCGDAVQALDNGDYQIRVMCRKCGDVLIPSGGCDESSVICGSCAS